MDAAHASGGVRPAGRDMPMAHGPMARQLDRQDLVLWIPADVPAYDAGIAFALPPAGPELAAFLSMFRDAERWARGRKADLAGAPELLAGGLRYIPIVWPQILRCSAPAFRPKTLHAMAKLAGDLKLSEKPFDAGTPCVLLEEEAEFLFGLCGADFNDCTGCQAFFCIKSTQSDVMFSAGLMLSCPSRTTAGGSCVCSIDMAELHFLLSPFAGSTVPAAAKKADKLLRQFCRDAAKIAVQARDEGMPSGLEDACPPADGRPESLEECAARLVERLGGIAASVPFSDRKGDGKDV